MTTPRVSILITTRNAAPYIGQCLDSVLAQDETFTDWECICTDDASEDGTAEIMEEYAAKDERFSYITRKERRTALPNLMDMIRVARGEIVAILDGDDWLLPGALARHLQEYDADATCDATYGQYECWPQRTKGHCQEVPVGRDWWEQWWFSHLLTWKRNLSLESFAKEPEAYLDPLTGKPYDITYDVALFFPVVNRARSVVFVPDVVYEYRRHYDNDDTGDGARKQLEAANRIMQYWRRNHG